MTVTSITNQPEASHVLKHGQSSVSPMRLLNWNSSLIGAKRSRDRCRIRWIDVTTMQHTLASKVLAILAVNGGGWQRRSVRWDGTISPLFVVVKCRYYVSPLLRINQSLIFV